METPVPPETPPRPPASPPAIPNGIPSPDRSAPATPHDCVFEYAPCCSATRSQLRFQCQAERRFQLGGARAATGIRSENKYSLATLSVPRCRTSSGACAASPSSAPPREENNSQNAASAHERCLRDSVRLRASAPVSCPLAV